MVKDEDDIIYENLVWHFAVGFRKFVIVDNKSADKTLELIRKFAAETKNIATVIVMEDPIVEHNQYRIMTGSYHFAHELWPEAKWFFPVDADEFWVFSENQKSAINKIPNNIDAVSAVRNKYYPTLDYNDMPKTEKFWRKLHHRDNGWFEFDNDKCRYVSIPKIFLSLS